MKFLSINFLPEKISMIFLYVKNKWKNLISSISQVATFISSKKAKLKESQEHKIKDLVNLKLNREGKVWDDG